MNRFSLNRKEKLLFALPLLVPLLVLVGPTVATVGGILARDSLDKTLHNLAGSQAVDCGVTPARVTVAADPCAIAAFQAGRPFLVRDNTTRPFGTAQGLVTTPQGQMYLVEYYRRTLSSKSALVQKLWPEPKVITFPRSKKQQIIYVYRNRKTMRVSSTLVWR